MGVYLDQKRRCDACHRELTSSKNVGNCKGLFAYYCRKEMCTTCQSKHHGWCEDCFKDEIGFIYDGEDEDQEQA